MPGGGVINVFHDYWVEWDPTYIKWYIDTTLMRTVNRTDVTANGSEWVYDNNKFILFNLALGGDYPPATMAARALPCPPAASPTVSSRPRSTISLPARAWCKWTTCKSGKALVVKKLQERRVRHLPGPPHAELEAWCGHPHQVVFFHTRTPWHTDAVRTVPTTARRWYQHGADRQDGVRGR